MTSHIKLLLFPLILINVVGLPVPVFAATQALIDSSPTGGCAAPTACDAVCPNTRDCPAISDTRNCRRKIFFSFIDDAACEAAKQSQNAVNTAQTAACRSAKSEAQISCEENRRRCTLVVETCNSLVSRPDAHLINHATILWVDDNPEGNSVLRGALEQLGASVTNASSTDEAKSRLEGRVFDVIISDFRRRDDPKGGYTLLSEVRKLKNPPPYIIYSGASNPTFAQQAKLRGAFDETSSPDELQELIVQALKIRGH